MSIGENLLAAAKRHMEKQRLMAHVMPAIAALLGGSVRDAVTAKLAALGMCKIASRCLKLHPSSRPVVEASLKCVVTFGASPGKLLLIHICNFHVLSHLLLIYICKLHWNPEYAKEMGASDVCSSLEAAMVCHSGSDVCVELFLQAVAALAGFDGNLKRLCASGVLRWVASLADHFLDREALVAAACQAISEVALDPECAEKMAGLRCSELLVHILSGHRKNELVCSWACRAVGRCGSLPLFVLIPT